MLDLIVFEHHHNNKCYYSHDYRHIRIEIGYVARIEIESYKRETEEGDCVACRRKIVGIVVCVYCKHVRPDERVHYEECAQGGGYHLAYALRHGVEDKRARRLDEHHDHIYEVAHKRYRHDVGIRKPCVVAQQRSISTTMPRLIDWTNGALQITPIKMVDIMEMSAMA